jgi:hypothetical protein
MLANEELAMHWAAAEMPPASRDNPVVFVAAACADEPPSGGVEAVVELSLLSLLSTPICSLSTLTQVPS